VTTIDYAALDKAATAAPWTVSQESAPPKRAFGVFGAPDPYPREVARYLAYDDHHRFEDVCALPAQVEANAALIVALRNGIADGSLVPRSEVDALVAAARVYVEWYGAPADFSPLIPLRAALAPFVEVGS